MGLSFVLFLKALEALHEDIPHRNCLVDGQWLTGFLSVLLHFDLLFQEEVAGCKLGEPLSIVDSCVGLLHLQSKLVL